MKKNKQNSEMLGLLQLIKMTIIFIIITLNKGNRNQIDLKTNKHHICESVSTVWHSLFAINS